MALLDHEAQVQACSVHLETMLMSVQEVHDCAKSTIGSEIILDAPMVLLGDDAQVEAHLGRLEIVVILTQDRCTICTERTTGSEIILDAPDGIPW
jgi:hypothetical protein